jgi:hypothetical protein
VAADEAVLNKVFFKKSPFQIYAFCVSSPVFSVDSPAALIPEFRNRNFLP